MKLADPPLLQHVLFEDPTDLCGLVVVVAILLSALARYRRSRVLAVAALGSVLLAGSLYGLARWVVTGREQIIQSSFNLISLTSPIQPDALESLLGPKAALSGPEGTPWLTASQVVTQLQRLGKRELIENNELTHARAELINDDSGRVIIELQTKLRYAPMDRPMKTRWLIEWARTGVDDAWQVTGIRWLEHPAPDGLKPRRGMWR